MMSPFRLVLLRAFAAACGGRDAPEREIPLAMGDTTAPAVVSPEELGTLPDSVRPSEAPPPAAPAPKLPKPAPARAAPGPAVAPAAAPPPAPPMLEAGTRVTMTSNAEISTRRNKAGDQFVATVTEAVLDSQGRPVIPAGATVTFRILELKEAENKDDAGTLTVRPEQVTIGGSSMAIEADVGELVIERQGRGVTVGDAGKVAGAAAAGAILGKIITKKGTGAAVGGVVGAAAGTAIAVKSADKDLVIPAGSTVVVVLRKPFPPS
ncbi:MAG TPA: hypothetical protein VF862_06335 [Gemmatimonadales bacterium]